MQLPGGWELVLILIVVMVLFGAKRLPDSARSLGRSLRIFKAETKGLRDDDVRTRAEAPHVRQPIDAADDPAYRRPADDPVYRRRADDTPSPAPVTDPVERREQR